MPKVHKSTSKECPSFVIISGAKYSGVPANYFKYFLMNTVYVFSSCSFLSVAKPKSVNLTCPVVVRRIFSGFKSL